jgi:dienelactone hydrolase
MMISILAPGCSSPSPPGGVAVACEELAPRNADEVAFCNELEQPVIAHLAVPEGEPPAAGWPGVVLLHGSGGLFVDGEDDECSEEVQEQFRDWAELLNERGYAVIMPASFYSRGFCEWHDRDILPYEYDDRERLVTRVYDAAAAAKWLCTNPDVNCSRIALLGFSNGASTALMLLHEDLGDADDPRLARLGPTPPFVGGVTYYPGCGLQGELANELEDSQLDRYYYPRAPVWVAHAEKDHLLDTCEELRDPQVDAIADERGVHEDMFELEVYPDAKHGFDEESKSKANQAARKAARARTLANFNEWMHGPGM